MSEHKYAQVWRWIADGKEVLGARVGGVECRFPIHFGASDIVNVVNGVDGYTFRLKPRTVMIGDIECEAPVLEPEEGQSLYWIDSDYCCCDSAEYAKDQRCSWVDLLRHGDTFASEEAAWAARNAITKLLTQGSTK